MALAVLIARKAAAADQVAPAERVARKVAGALLVGPAPVRAARKPRASKVAAEGVALAVSNEEDVIRRVPMIYVRVIRI